MQQVGEGTPRLTLTTRFLSTSLPDAHETTTGNWLVPQIAVPPVVKVREIIHLSCLVAKIQSDLQLEPKQNKLKFAH